MPEVVRGSVMTRLAGSSLRGREFYESSALQHIVGQCPESQNQLFACWNLMTNPDLLANEDKIGKLEDILKPPA